MLEQDMKKILFTHEDIVKRSKELGMQITKDYAENPPLVVALLRGSVPFLAELIQHIDLDIQYDFMDVTSYEGTESIGDIKIIKDLDTSVKDMDILLVEDIVDTGVTLNYLKSMLEHRGAASIRIAALLDKTARRTVPDLKVDYVCFDIPDAFVVGYGLDYDQTYRNLPDIGVLSPKIYGDK